MAYAQSGVIEAVDYNGLILADNNQLNAVWGTGIGSSGYGQTAIPTVSAPNVVTATQWATLINAVNNARAHQTGNASITGFSSVAAGDTVNFLSTLQTQVNSAYTDRLSYGLQGATTTGGTFLRNVVSTSGLPTWQVIDMQVTFASADHARYFFNAGGQLNYVVGHNASGSGAAQSLGRVISAIGGLNFSAETNSGRTGSGITLDTNQIVIGYYDLNTTPQTVVLTTDTTASYTGSNSALQLFSYDGTSTNGAKGYLVVFRLLYDVDDKIWDDTIDLLIQSRIDIVAPETTYLTNSWGTPTSGITWNDVFNRFNRGQGTGNNCTLLADGSVAGPFNNSVPMRMTQTGDDTHTATYNAFIDNLSAASVGDQFRITYWARASTNVTIEGAWLPNANSVGGYLSGSTYISGTVNGSIALTTSWQRFSTVWQVANASTAYVQIRLDGTQSGGNGTTVWWDHLTLEKVS